MEGDGILRSSLCSSPLVRGRSYMPLRLGALYLQGLCSVYRGRVVYPSILSNLRDGGGLYMRAAPIWLMAKSNVAVKNIAEKLVKLEFFKFKLLVSKDFYKEW